jgi:hypothetical protein
LPKCPSGNFAHVVVRIFEAFYEGVYRLGVAKLAECPSCSLADVTEFIGQRGNKWEHRAGVTELAEGFGSNPSNVAVFGV